MNQINLQITCFLLLSKISLADKFYKKGVSKYYGDNKSPSRQLFISSNIPLRYRYRIHKKQISVVKGDRKLLNIIEKGLQLAIKECQHQFRERHWNCPVIDSRGNWIFGKIKRKGCRESAFVHAIASAGVAHAVSRACAEGSIKNCSCIYRRARYSNNVDIEWEGCSDNIDFGYRFAKRFIDVTEKGRDLRYLINLHNNEAGRLSVKRNMKKACKCHGMSGSCTIQTCWYKLPSFREVGAILKDKFDGASKVIATNDGRSFTPEISSIKLPSSDDLVYSEESPNFCRADRSTGSLGTQGRECNITSKGIDGCDLLCCGRGANAERINVNETCRCRFNWCCEVTCDVCSQKKTIYTCK